MSDYYPAITLLLHGLDEVAPPGLRNLIERHRQEVEDQTRLWFKAHQIFIDYTPEEGK